MPIASAPIRINMLHVGSPSEIPLLIAQEHGIFRQHGVDVHLVFVPGFAVPHLTTENPFGYIGAPAVLLRAVEGITVKILGSFNTARLSGHVVARPEITEPDDLPGKRFGVRALGAAQWIQTMLALKYLGLDAKRDHISTLAIGDPTQVARALEAGTIDAAVLPPAQSGQLRARGFSVLVDLYPANIYGSPNALAVTDVYLQQAPVVVELVVAGLIEGAAFSLAPANKTAVLRTIMTAFNISDPSAAEAGYQEYIGAAIRKPYPSLERLRTMQQTMAEHDPRLSSIPIEDLIDDRFVRNLDESGAIDQLAGRYGLQ